MKFLIYIICIFNCSASMATAVNLIDVEFNYTESYVDNGWTVFTKPILRFDNRSYRIIVGSSFEALCEQLGFEHSQSYNYFPNKSVIPAGLKAEIFNEGYVQLTDETENFDCFLGLCFGGGQVQIPARKFGCK